MRLHKTTHKHVTCKEVFAINPIVVSVAAFLHLYLLWFHMHAAFALLILFRSPSALLSSRRKKSENEEEKFRSSQKGSQHNSCIISTSEIFFLLSCTSFFPHIFSGRKSQRSCECSQMTFLWLKEVCSTWRKPSVSVIASILSYNVKGSKDKIH